MNHNTHIEGQDLNPRKGSWIYWILGVLVFLILLNGLIGHDGHRGVASKAPVEVKTILPPKPALTEAEKVSILKRFSKSRDKMEGITWYESKRDKETYDSRMMLYMGSTTDSYWLRMKIRYYGDDWLFLEGVKFLIDGTVIDYPFNKYEVKRDNSSGSVWEWIDVKVNENEMGLLTLLANGNSTEMRFIGSQYRRDRKITKAERQAIKDMLSAFEKLK
ncbi:hypothetical protein ACJVC5_10870 [Peredibacter sp. HCB2-198]|uniref:hypothetical protein n=1 Tax=Peredibacter sp. HCB2-198 TaxID=3383025 RepID=UPI0038B5502E